MSSLLRQILAVLGVVFLAAALYIGTYLPYRKGASYIEALSRAQQARTIGEFLTTFAKPLDHPSPVGQEELVRNLGNTIGDVILGNGTRDPSIIEPALAFFDHYAQPLLDRDKGLSFMQLLLVNGSVHEAAYSVTGIEHYSEEARGYFERGLAMSPNRPEFLYALFSDAQMRGDTAAIRARGEQILSVWPDDAKVRQALDLITTSTPQ